MYYKCACEQITVFDFNQGFGFHIDKDNRWVKLSEQIPWSEAEELYAANFNSTTGNKAISFRTTLGALIIRRVFHLSDRATVKSIQENPYLQYFLGVQKYTPNPLFDPIGAASGITAAAPTFTNSRATFKSGYIYGITIKPSAANISVALIVS